MKKLICVLAVFISGLFVFSGCYAVSGRDGADGKDGSDVSIYEIYEAVNSERKNSGLEELDFLQFVSEYLSYDSKELEEAVSMQTSINRSYLSGVSILSTFKYTTDVLTGFGWGGTSSKKYAYHKVYCGAGVIIDLDLPSGDAYVITNCHVVYDDESDDIYASDIYLYLYGQDTEGVNYTLNSSYVTGNIYDYSITNDKKYRIEAELISASVTYDIALLKVSGSSVLKSSSARAAVFADSDEVYAGEQVYAIGDPEGDGMSATAGIISKESELIELNLSTKYANKSSYFKQYRVIRTDAAINGGNSGGGLYNCKGELLGIINSKSVSDEIDNMGYALPGSNVKRLWQLMRDTSGAQNPGGVTRAYLPTGEYDKTAKVFNCGYHISSSRAVEENGKAVIYEVVTVTSDGGGLLTGDNILGIKIDTGSEILQKEVTRLYHVDDFLLSVRDGYSVTVTVSRGGEKIEVPVECIFQKVD